MYNQNPLILLLVEGRKATYDALSENGLYPDVLRTSKYKGLNPSFAAWDPVCCNGMLTCVSCIGKIGRHSLVVVRVTLFEIALPSEKR